MNCPRCGAIWEDGVRKYIGSKPGSGPRCLRCDGAIVRKVEVPPDVKLYGSYYASEDRIWRVYV